ncbi:MAG: PAS domain S-box protein [Sideroxydans sp.]|nr:PAS domain S-box protein [Sideroxydans sp.]
MNKKPDNPNFLRAQAEARLGRAPSTNAHAQSSETLLHELQVHQIELEMQNEHLRETQTALEESRDRYVGLYEFAPVGYITLSRAGQIAAINLTACTLLGRERGKLLQHRFDFLVSPSDRDRWHIFFVGALKQPVQQGIELALQRGDNAQFFAHLDCLNSKADGHAQEFQIALTDISAMRLNQQLLESEERLRVATETARDAIIMLEAESGAITTWNHAAETIFGYTRDEALGQVLHDFLVPQRFREQARSGMAHFAASGEGAAVNKTSELIARHKNGNEFPIELSLSAMQIDGKWFASGIARDITQRKQTEAALINALEQNQQHLAQMRDSLEDTVKAISSIVEVRDPYTSGHQVRVAALAAAIAKQMSLPEEQVHAIYLAGVVHDLGKIQIPAEILSKPGKLNAIEFRYIKTHAQAGFDILKDIKFPWPIAQMVLQHHERLDGSGYPQGLKDGDILPEARILAVADVVEAMSSHRPYRPGLGMEAALAEIGRGSGQQFDAAVVAACCKVVRDNGMKLPE